MRSALPFSISDIASEDADIRAGQALVEKLFICTTPRCAGHTLCADLRSAGIGVPAEYFGPQLARPIANRFGLKIDEKSGMPMESHAYAERLMSLRSNGGVFSAKLFFRDLRHVRRSFPDMGNVTYLFLRRSDLVSQTISPFALLLSEKPFDSDERIETGLGTIPRTRDSALEIYRWLVRQNLLWRDHLSTKSRVFMLETETFLRDRRAAVAALLRLMGKHLPNVDPSSQQGAYQVDRELKLQLEDEFGHAIRDIDALQAPFNPPPNAVPVC